METLKQTKTPPASLASRLSEIKRSTHWPNTRANRWIRLKSLYVFILPNGPRKYEQMRESWRHQRWILTNHPSSSNGIHILLCVYLFRSSKNIPSQEAQGTSSRLHHIPSGRCIHYWNLLLPDNDWHCKNDFQIQDLHKETKEKTIS